MILLILLPLSLFGISLIYVYQNQERIVQTEIDAINRGYRGMISVGDIRLAPFKNFPYLSVRVDDVAVRESKETDAASIAEVADIYIGLDLTDLVQGKIDIKKLLIEDGYFEMVLHKDGSDNLSNAFATESDTTAADPLHIHLRDIELKNIDVRKKDESNGLVVQGKIHWARGGFQSTPQHTAAHIDTEFDLNIIKNGDTTYVKQKQFAFQTDLDFDESTGILEVAPSKIEMEHSDFELSGLVNTRNNMDLDLEIIGSKSNFDLFLAFAPNEVAPVLKRYENAGKIYFNAKLQGPAGFGYRPFFDVKFGADEAFLENTDYGRRIEDMSFEGHFTNGAKRDPTTMEFSMVNITAKPGQGDFVGAIHVLNFESPEIEMSLDAKFELDFIAEFLNLTDYKDASGTIDLSMKFHDIIDLDHPERALDNLNQAYYSELNVKNVTVNSTDLPAPLKSLNAHVVMRGQKAELDLFEVRIGESDLSITGYLSDLPAILHQSDVTVKGHLDIRSEVLDVAELTRYVQDGSQGLDERIEGLALGLTFESTAQNLAQFTYLPKGEFFVDSLHAELKHYPHTLHDFHVDLLIDERDLRIKDFAGYIDASDFRLNGMVHDYSFCMKDTLAGDVNLDLGLKSKLLRLEDILAYQGQNYVPEEYRHEEFEHLSLHLTSSMHYNASGLHSIDVTLDRFDAKMHLHPMRFQDVRGRFRYEDEQLLVNDFHAQLGRTILNVDMNYYLGKDSTRTSTDNFLTLKTNYIDFDQLTNFNPNPPASREQSPQTEGDGTQEAKDISAHAEAYNLYELPFSDMDFDLQIGHFIYHRLDIRDINAKLRTTEDHYLYVDTLQMTAAGGDFNMNGYFNGSDPTHIYLKPNLRIEHVDLDQLLFKFENFGQDAIVSENLHGQLSATVTGNIRVYPDFVPDLDESEVHMDVMALNGRLENYDYMLMLSDYFGDKNLSSVRFDTLQNHLDVVNGVLTIPYMTIESTLGHLEISGEQDTDHNIEYYVRIPWELVRKGAVNRVFGKKKKEDEETGEDEIIEVDPNDKVRYLNLKITGTPDDFDIRPGKDKKKKKKAL